MIRVGITGQAGFVGTHLYNTLGLYPQKFERIPFDDSYFQNRIKLGEFVSQCDAIVHLAAMNRHIDPQVIYKTNIGLVEQLLDACTARNALPHILFSSSTQEERDNLYGRSKKEGRELFEKWADKNGTRFTGLVIPNVFGPFGQPYYNSVVATFCHQLTHEEKPKIEFDSEISLIYVAELVAKIIEAIEYPKEVPNSPSVKKININPTSSISVSQLLTKLTNYRDQYFNNGTIPDLRINFDKNLWNTFLCYIEHKNFFPFNLKLNSDNRGSFIETVKLNSGGQVSFSTTFPGVTRGNHYHTRKAERFAVIKGKARIDFRRIGTNKIFSFDLNGAQPSFVDMPIWYTHNIANVGDEELYTIFWINEHYDSNDPDTFFEEV